MHSDASDSPLVSVSVSIYIYIRTGRLEISCWIYNRSALALGSRDEDADPIRSIHPIFFSLSAFAAPRSYLPYLASFFFKVFSVVFFGTRGREAAEWVSRYGGVLRKLFDFVCKCVEIFISRECMEVFSQMFRGERDGREPMDCNNN